MKIWSVEFFLQETSYARKFNIALWQNFKNQTSYVGKLCIWEHLNQEALY